MPIGADWTIDYTNRMIYHSSGTTIYEMYELYSWIMDEIDESGTIDDTVPMTAQTPTAYTLVNSWYINENYYSSFQYLKGGAVKTTGWNALTNNTGIRVITFGGTYNGCVSTDIGKGVTGLTSGHTGTLLDYDNTLQRWWIRVDDTGDTFNNTTETIDVDAGTGDGVIDTGGTNSTGEALWTNIYTLGTIQDETTMYVYQNNSQLTGYWSEGHIDILVKVRQAGSLIDFGNLTVYARKYSTLYENFAVDASPGGRIPIPMGTADDLNNDTGYVLLNCSSGSGTFTVGEVIGDNASRSSATALAIVTAVNGTTADPDLDIYYVGDLTAFSASDVLTGYDSGATATVDTVSATGPNTGTPATITVTFGDTTQDLNNGYGDAPYSVIVDLQGTATVAEAYERLKYLTRRGATGDIDDGAQTVVGEQYEAVGDYYIPYDTLTVSTFTEGGTISSTDQSTFSGTITSDHDRLSSDGFLIVRNVSGTIPTDGQNLTDDTSGALALVDTAAGADPVEVIAQTNDAPFGTFAGGKFFGARGVFLANVPTAYSTLYELIDSEGVQQVPPNIVNVTVTGVVQNTQCYVYDSTPTTYLNAAATTNVSGDQYRATNTYTYTDPPGDIAVTVRAREMGYLPFEASGSITSSGISVTAVWLVDANFKFVVSGESITFTNATSLITRGTGDFGTDGWLSIMSEVEVAGSTSNDGTYTITAVSTNTITVSGTLTDGTDATGVTLTYTRRTPTW